MNSQEVILLAKRVKNMYVADMDSIQENDLSYFSAQSENIELWHKKLGHVSSLLLNKLSTRDLVCGLPKVRFAEDKVFEACVKGKQTRSLFKQKKKVSTTRPL